MKVKAKNIGELEAIKQAKVDNFYGVKASENTITKDVDFSKRTVKVITNTFLYFDSDQDVLLPGCTKKTVEENGPNSKTAAKIKNVKDHRIDIRIGVPQLIEEKEIDGKKGQYAESKLLNTSVGNDMLIEYQEGAVDQHSIGFLYSQISIVTADDEEWTKYLNMLINPNDAEEYGYMFIVPEIKQFEFSPVSFGANRLTPYLGVKSENKDALALKAIERVTWLEKQYRSGKQSDERLQDYYLQSLQLKQIIKELFTTGPSIKNTLLEDSKKSRSTTDTQEKATGSNQSTDSKGVNSELDFKELLTIF